MDVADFEQDILKLAFETDVRITTASVAYYLGIPSTKAGPMLEELLERGVLELDSDQEGNLFYRVADATEHDAGEISRLRQERLAGVDGGTDRSEESDGEMDGRPYAPRNATIGGARVDELDGPEPLDPKSHDGQSGRIEEDRPRRIENDAQPRDGEGRTGTVGRRPIVESSRTPSDRPSDPVDVVSRRGTKRETRRRRERGTDEEEEQSVPGVVSSTDGVFAGVTRKRAAMDASIDNCGEEPVVVQSKARCQPRPLADSNPVLASCSDRERGRRAELVPRNEEYGAVGHVNQRHQPAKARSGAAASLMYRGEDHLEKPEHQPGMSLLLSLILCGTGQIYNGEVSKGIMMMVLCFLLWFVLLGWVVHIWSIVDSVVVAERINRQSNN